MGGKFHLLTTKSLWENVGKNGIKNLLRTVKIESSRGQICYAANEELAYCVARSSQVGSLVTKIDRGHEKSKLHPT